MKCDFCGREVEKGVTECPYCHYQFKIEAKVLSSDERDTFEGVTIEEDGSTTDSSAAAREQREQQQSGSQWQQNVPPRLKVHSYGCGSGMLMTLLILGGILALVFFLLPAFLVFAAIGAAVVFILRLFM